MKKAWLAIPLSAALLLGSIVPTGTALDSATQNEASAATKKYYFKNNVAKLDDVKVKITKKKIIKPGQKGNEYGDKPIIAFWYTTTNLSNKDISPLSAWIAIFSASQSTTNYTAKLNLGGAPSDAHSTSQFYDIKKGKSLKSSVSYELVSNKPVPLKAHKGIGGKYLGKKVYKVK